MQVTGNFNPTFDIESNLDLLAIPLRIQYAIDKSRGHAFLHDGDMYYSPNCSREVSVPLPLPYGGNPFYPKRQGNGRYNLWELDTSIYKKPAWWTLAFGWQAFIEITKKNLDSLLFAGLRPSTAPYRPEDSDDYMLSPWEQNEWLRLDRQISKACQLLTTHYRLNSILPWDPWDFGYLKPHPHYGALKVCLRKALEWFVISMGRLSYLIAAGETRSIQFRDEPTFKRLPWMEVLLHGGNDVGIDRQWLDMLYQTTIACFGSETERAGIFVQLTEGPELHIQPNVPWFCNYHIPVWYRWSSTEASRPDFQSLAPLPHQLQIATTFITDSLASPDPHPPQTPRRLCTKKMEEFFKLRELRTKTRLANETARERERRISREKQIPVLSAPMYVWRNNGHGEYERELVPRACRDEIRNTYDDDQMKYDPLYNEWDVCGAWGDPDDDDDDEPVTFYEVDDGDRSQPPDTITKGLGYTLEMERIPVSHLSGDASSLPECFEGEILTVLALYFGYTPLIPVPSAAVVAKEVDRKRLCRSLGIDWQHIKTAQQAFERPSVAAALDFFIQLAKNSSIADDEWDLSANNRNPIALTPRFRSFLQVVSTDGKVLYLLDTKDRMANWYLALKHASDVAVISRLPPEKNEYNIVEFLLENGIPFHTLAPTSTLLRTPAPFDMTWNPSKRPAHYVFTGRDYLAYREHCNYMLKHPRARAALMHGGIIWRLAVSIVPWEMVFKGPSGWSPNNPERIIVKHPKTGMELLDDRLTEAEEELLCGTYKCDTDVQHQEVRVSWYMPSSLYIRSGQDHGRWTAYSERIFNLLDTTNEEETEAGQLGDEPGITQQPNSRSTWRTQTRGIVEIFKALLRVDKVMCNMFNA